MTFFSTASAIPPSASGKISLPSKWKSFKAHRRPSTAAAPPAARSTSSPSKRPTKNFYNAETTFAGDGTRRVTFDVNQVIDPTLAIRLDGMWQNANVAERNDTFDDRGGALAAIKWAPNDSFKLTANYVHTNLWSLPDFGVPYNGVEGAPVTSLGVPRDTYYGFDNRDFQKVQQDFGTVDSEYIVNNFVTLNNKIRDEQSILNYVGTIPEQSTSCNGTATTLAGANPANWTVCLNPLSRHQVTTVQADQSSATIKFAVGPVKNTVVTGAEVDRKGVHRQL